MVKNLIDKELAQTVVEYTKTVNIGDVANAANKQGLIMGLTLGGLAVIGTTLIASNAISKRDRKLETIKNELDNMVKDLQNK